MEIEMSELDSSNALEVVKNAFEETPWTAISQGLARGERQASSRARVISIINSLCDTLQLAGDLVSTVISKLIVEYSDVRDRKPPDPETLRAYFSRVFVQLDEPQLRILLHEGRVCGELHRLADRLKQPFTQQSEI
jgi:hypothetical protein